MTSLKNGSLESISAHHDVDDDDGASASASTHTPWYRRPRGADPDVERARDSEEGGQASGTGKLRRDLSARQVQMIAIGGTIGTGLFLGTGRSLAQGGPASILICYGLVGFIVYVTLLLLGEMGTQYPVAGSFTAYSTRFFSPSYGFALSWNYWFNDAVSVASDLTAAQLVLNYWTDQHTWVISLVFLIFLLLINATSVSSYGEMEYILSSLKVATIVAFIIVGIAVNVGGNRDHHYIGGHNWHIPGAPFVGGFGGFARVFVTASFAYGGTESLGITAGETRNPSRNMPRVVKFVFWRILIFYVLSILIVGLNVPYDYPNLSNRSTTTSPFTIVFFEAGSNVAASFMNTVILTSVLSAGNHAMFAGTRVLYSLATSSPPLAPRIFGRTTRRGVPLLALLASSSISALCFGSSFIGSGELWGWLQNIVGVSNQIAWLSIGLASFRFRKAWVAQGRPLSEMKFRARWTWPWGPLFVIISVTIIIIIQGWTSVIPKFSAVDFVSLYLEIPVMIVMYIFWAIFRALPVSAQLTHAHAPPPRPVHSGADNIDEETAAANLKKKNPKNPSATAALAASVEVAVLDPPQKPTVLARFADLVPLHAIDLYSDEHAEDESDRQDDEERARHLKGRWRLLWKVWYILA